MVFKDWNAFLKDTNVNKIGEAGKQPKLLLSAMGEKRKAVWDTVLGKEAISAYKEQMQAFVGIKQEAIMINRFWDNIEAEATSLFTAFKDSDNTILNKMLMNLKIFLINNETVFYNTSWNIILYVLNKEFSQLDAYMYFSHLVLKVYPAGFFMGRGRCGASHCHKRVFGMLASNYGSDLQKVLSVTLNTKSMPAGSDAQKQLAQNQKKVDKIGVLEENKENVRNREAFIELMEKIADCYLSNMFVSVTDHQNILRIMDIAFFAGFRFFINMGLKLIAKLQPSVVKKVKADLAILTKSKQPIDVQVMRQTAELSFSLFQQKITSSDLNAIMKGAIEDKKLHGLIDEQAMNFQVLAQSEQMTNEGQYNYNKRVHALQHACYQMKQRQGLQDVAQQVTVNAGVLKLMVSSQNNEIERKKLYELVTNKANNFMFDNKLAQMFDMLLMDDNYGQLKAKIKSVQINFIMISQQSISEKLHQMINVIAPSPDDQYSLRRITSALVELEQHLDPRIRCLEIDSSLNETLKEKMNPELHCLTLQEIVETIIQSPNFYPIQQFMLAIDMDYQKIPTEQQFQEIYNRASPNQSFNMGDNNQQSDNDTIITPQIEGENGEQSFVEKDDNSRKCQCLIF